MIREEIKKALDEEGISHSEMSRQLGMFQSNFNSWLSGVRTIPYPAFLKMLNILGLSIGPKAVGFSYIPADDLPEIFFMQMRQTGIKICDIARQTGIDPSVLSAYLTGARRMSTNNIEKTMEVLGLGIVRCTSAKTVAVE